MYWAQVISRMLRGIASRVVRFVLGWRKEATRDTGDKKDGPSPHSRPHPRPRPRPRRGKKKSKRPFDREVEKSAEDDSMEIEMEVADEEEAAESKVADEEEAAEREEVVETAKKRASAESQGGVRRRRKQRRGDRPEINTTMVLTPSPQPPPRLSTGYWDFIQYEKGQRNIFRLHNHPQSSMQDQSYDSRLFAEESNNGRGM